MQLVSSFTQAQLNTIPFEGSWTAGQVADHMVMSNEGFSKILTGPAKETNRPPDERVATIQRDFLDLTLKVTAAQIVWPKHTRYNKEELLQSLTEIEVPIKAVIQNLDLTETCLAFEIPVYGYLTRIEALHFNIYHSKRHIVQLKILHERLHNPTK